jgi:MFS family permease
MSTTESGPSRSVILCIIGSLFLRLGNSATGTLMVLLLAASDREGGNVSANSVGLLAAAFYVSELLGAPWFGAQSDRRGRRPFMVMGPILGALAIQLIGWPRMLLAMAVGRVLEGLSTASTAPSTLSYLSAMTVRSAALRARVMAWYEMATVVGIAGGFVAAGLLWDTLGNLSFIAVTGIYGLSLAAFWWVRDVYQPPADAREGGSPLLAVLRYPSVLQFVPAWLAVNTILGAWFIHSAFVLTGAPRAGQHLAGAFTGSGLSAIFSGLGLAFVVGIFLWGTAMGGRRRTSIMLATLPGIFLICAALFGLNHAQDSGLTGLLLTVLLGISVAIASGFTPAALSYLADLSEEAPHLRGAIMGLYSVLLGLGQLMGGALGGPFAEAGKVDGLILFTAILGGLATAVVLILRRLETRPLTSRGEAAL